MSIEKDSEEESDTMASFYQALSWVSCILWWLIFTVGVGFAYARRQCSRPFWIYYVSLTTAALLRAVAELSANEFNRRGLPLSAVNMEVLVSVVTLQLSRGIMLAVLIAAASGYRISRQRLGCSSIATLASLPALNVALPLAMMAVAFQGNSNEDSRDPASEDPDSLALWAFATGAFAFVTQIVILMTLLIESKAVKDMLKALVSPESPSPPAPENPPKPGPRALALRAAGALLGLAVSRVLGPMPAIFICIMAFLAIILVTKLSEEMPSVEAPQGLLQLRSTEDSSSDHNEEAVRMLGAYKFLARLTIGLVTYYMAFTLVMMMRTMIGFLDMVAATTVFDLAFTTFLLVLTRPQKEEPQDYLPLALQENSTLLPPQPQQPALPEQPPLLHLQPTQQPFTLNPLGQLQTLPPLQRPLLDS